jgi:hypothetical protein
MSTKTKTLSAIKLMLIGCLSMTAIIVTGAVNVPNASSRDCSNPKNLKDCVFIPQEKLKYPPECFCPPEKFGRRDSIINPPIDKSILQTNKRQLQSKTLSK